MLVGEKHIAKTRLLHQKQKRAEISYTSACQLESEGGLNSHRTQYGLIDCAVGGAEFYGTQKARIIFYFLLLLRRVSLDSAVIIKPIPHK